ncbi:MAG TPA: BON domain-containing protein [Oligoflexus sp.]|uniref:BON domain-containing protein n=1 Tax=Oligoflexus sp. TaxID=1971216 RepID=UPI002D6EC8CD|nr:BON domain-containing protein [Oligoflexus sp.]HYX34434.1 BON domain-containing protein [Oligoflexus sp.]
MYSKSSILFAGAALLSVTLARAENKVPDAMNKPISSTSTPTDTTGKKIQDTKHGDDSRRNAIHDGKTAVSASQASNDPADVEITRKIRQAVVKEDGLSIYAQNIKIITIEGRVVLKGPVRTNDEKKKVESMAMQVAGKDNVVSEIEVTH